MHKKQGGLVTVFNIKYEIIPSYLTVPSKRRSGIKMNRVGFIVAHDTGNPNSTAMANVKYYERSKNDVSASAHIFVDDKDIIECIPALTGTPEKAWHVLYETPLDNQLFGDDANDIAIGVEYCYGTNINATEAYKRYVWVLAYICYRFNLNPAKAIIGHMILDPKRKTDPQNGLKHSGRSYQQLLQDVVNEYQNCLVAKEPKEDKLMEDDFMNFIMSEQGKKYAKDAISSLAEKGFLNNPDDWKKRVDDGTIYQELPWLTLVLLDRTTNQYFS